MMIWLGGDPGVWPEIGSKRRRGRQWSNLNYCHSTHTLGSGERGDRSAMKAETLLHVLRSDPTTCSESQQNQPSAQLAAAFAAPAAFLMIAATAFGCET